MKMFEPQSIVILAALVFFTAPALADDAGDGTRDTPDPNSPTAENSEQVGLQNLKYVVVVETDDGEFEFRYTPERELKTEDLSKSGSK